MVLSETEAGFGVEHLCTVTRHKPYVAYRYLFSFGEPFNVAGIKLDAAGKASCIFPASLRLSSGLKFIVNSFYSARSLRLFSLIYGTSSEAPRSTTLLLMTVLLKQGVDERDD